MTAASPAVALRRTGRGRRLGLRGLVAAGASLLLLGAAPAVARAPRAGEDVRQGVVFTLVGETVDVTLTDPSGRGSHRSLDELEGTSVAVACRGRDAAGGAAQVAVMEATWVHGSASLRGPLTADVARDTSWCVLERISGLDLAVARTFRAAPADAAGSPTS